jgi:hypothetical protein
MNTDWILPAIYYIGLFDAAVIMLGGLVAATVSLLGLELYHFWDRVLPAGIILILSNLAAAIVLGATRWLV